MLAPEITAKQSHRITSKEITIKLNNNPRFTPIENKPIISPLENQARKTGMNASRMNNPLFSIKGIT